VGSGSTTRPRAAVQEREGADPMARQPPGDFKPFLWVKSMRIGRRSSFPSIVTHVATPFAPARLRFASEAILKELSMKTMQRFATATFVALSAWCLAGCAAHSPMIIKNTTDTHPIGQSQYPPHHDKVFVTQQSLPSSVAVDQLATIEVGKIWYGSSKNVEISMADRARELGANAVIQVKTWHQPSGFSWAAPHGSGVAVRVDPKALESLSGIWQ
jgi:hypothetical protein